MKKIKTRIWSKKTKSWVTNYVIREDGVVCDVGSAGDLYAKPGELEIMISTGTNDIDGKEIFEGDILEFNKKYYEVKIPYFYYDYAQGYGYITHGKVVGNIFKNSLLLSKKLLED